MGEVILVEIAAGKNRIDDRQPCGRTIAHRNRRGAIQLDDWRWIGAQQHVVQTDDLRPVRVGCGSRLGMNGGYRRLQRVRPEPATRQCALDKRAAFARNSERRWLANRSSQEHAKPTFARHFNGATVGNLRENPERRLAVRQGFEF